MTRHTIGTRLAQFGCIALLSDASLAQSYVVTFGAGSSGWSNSGRTAIDPVGGNPGSCIGEFIDDVWGVEVRTDEPGLSVDPFLGDLARYGPFRIGVDSYGLKPLEAVIGFPRQLDLRLNLQSNFERTPILF